QAGAEGGSRNPEDDIVLGEGSDEIRLRDVASYGIRPPGDGKQIVDAAIANAIGGRIDILEARFPDRAIERDEGGHHVRRSIQTGHRDLGIGGGTRTTDCRLEMASRATVQVEAGAETSLRSGDGSGDG